MAVGLDRSCAQMAHSCVVNTNHSIDEKRFEMTVRASVPIAKGQPIFLSYANTLQGRIEESAPKKRRSFGNGSFTSLRFHGGGGGHDPNGGHTSSTILLGGYYCHEHFVDENDRICSNEIRFPRVFFSIGLVLTFLSNRFYLVL